MPHCLQQLEAGQEVCGTEITFPKCQQSIQVPTLAIEAPPPEEPKPLERQPVITTTSNEISGRTIEKYLGIVSGIIVRSPTSTDSLFGGLKQIVGGNIEAYAKLCRQARADAYDRMMQDALRMNADAVIAFRFDATEFSPGVTEVMAYGTAVKLGASPP